HATPRQSIRRARPEPDVPPSQCGLRDAIPSGLPGYRNGEIISLSEILQRVAYPVEPFRLEIVQNDLSPALLGGHRDSSGKPPDLFDQANDCLANEVQHLHRIT